jgi:uncharacterized integral membrane protein
VNWILRNRNAILFTCGILAVALSLALGIAIYMRPVTTNDYFKQAAEGFPWVMWGFGSAVTGCMLCFFFGKSKWRTVALILSVLLCEFWFLQMGALV